MLVYRHSVVGVCEMGVVDLLCGRGGGGMGRRVGRSCNGRREGLGLGFWVAGGPVRWLVGGGVEMGVKGEGGGKGRRSGGGGRGGIGLDILEEA